MLKFHPQKFKGGWLFFIVADSLSLKKTQFVELLKLKFRLLSMSTKHLSTQTVQNNNICLSYIYFVLYM